MVDNAERVAPRKGRVLAPTVQCPSCKGQGMLQPLRQGARDANPSERWCSRCDGSGRIANPRLAPPPEPLLCRECGAPAQYVWYVGMEVLEAWFSCADHRYGGDDLPLPANREVQK